MNKDEIYSKIEILEKKKMSYLEVDNKANARRIAKQIKDLELQAELLKFNELRRELSIYKKVVSKYPGMLSEINKLLIEQKIK